MNNGTYDRHGSYIMYKVDRVIVVEAIGTWNLETAMHWSEAFKKEVRQFKGEPWGCLVDLTKFSLAVPEVWEHVNSLNLWSSRNSQRYEAVVCAMAIQKAFMQKSHQFLPNVEITFCKTIDEAKCWLSNKTYL